MSFSENFNMMKDFFGSYFKYRNEIKKYDSWIKKFAKQKGYTVNPHWMFFTNLKLWIHESQQTFGKRYCPCFEPSDNPELNKKMLCPCQFAAQEISEKGSCHCVLFGRNNFTDADFKKAESNLMKEYRVPLNLKNGTLDTRGMTKDKLRNLPIPDSLRQVKRALGLVKHEIKVIAETEEEAENLSKLARAKGLVCSYVKNGDYYTVTLTK